MTTENARYCVRVRSSAWQRYGQIALTGALLLLAGCSYGQKTIVVKDRGWGGKQFATVDVWQDTKTLKYYYTHPDTGKRHYVTSSSTELTVIDFDYDHREYRFSKERLRSAFEADDKH